MDFGCCRVSERRVATPFALRLVASGRSTRSTLLAICIVLNAFTGFVLAGLLRIHDRFMDFGSCEIVMRWALTASVLSDCADAVLPDPLAAQECFMQMNNSSNAKLSNANLSNVIRPSPRVIASSSRRHPAAHDLLCVHKPKHGSNRLAGAALPLNRIAVACAATDGPAAALRMLRAQPQEIYCRTFIGMACKSFEHAAILCRPSGDDAELLAACLAVSRGSLRRGSPALPQTLFQLEHLISERADKRRKSRLQRQILMTALLDAAHYTLLVTGIVTTCCVPMDGLYPDDPDDHAHRTHDMALEILQNQLDLCVVAADNDAESAWQCRCLVKLLGDHRRS